MKGDPTDLAVIPRDGLYTYDAQASLWRPSFASTAFGPIQAQGLMILMVYMIKLINSKQMI